MFYKHKKIKFKGFIRLLMATENKQKPDQMILKINQDNLLSKSH